LKVCYLDRSAAESMVPTIEGLLGESLRHPNVVQVYGSEIVQLNDCRDTMMMAGADGLSSAGYSKHMANEADSLICKVHVVQEYCSRGDLRGVLKRGGLEGQKRGADGEPNPPHIPAALTLALDVASGMTYIHSMNIIHGDLKASNVLLAHRGDAPGNEFTAHVAKIADFGLAKVLDNDATHMSGVFTGTVTHLAPEALQEGRQSLSADVYAFGILLCELVSGQKVYPGKTAPWIVDAVVNKRYRPPLPPTTSPALMMLVERCTEHDPSLRPTMEEVAASLADLRALQYGQPGSTGGETRTVRAPLSRRPSAICASSRLGLGGSRAPRRTISFSTSSNTSIPYEPRTPSATAQHAMGELGARTASLSAQAGMLKSASGELQSTHPDGASPGVNPPDMTRGGDYSGSPLSRALSGPLPMGMGAARRLPRKSATFNSCGLAPPAGSLCLLENSGDGSASDSDDTNDDTIVICMQTDIIAEEASDASMPSTNTR